MKMGWLLAAAAAALVVSCGGDDDPTAGSIGPSGSLTVFAAASLTDAFGEMGEAFEAANPGVSVAFNFAGSAALRAQIEEGAPADVFASANTSHMDQLHDAGLAGAPAVFAHNSLVVIAPNDNPGGIETLADLAKPGLKLVLAADAVPAGGYARDMLAKADGDPAFGAGFSEAVLANLVSNESNVKQVVTKVALGEADAGIVYGSDVTAAVAPDLQTIEVPAAVNVVADYPIAVLSESDHPEAAREFVDFVLSVEGQTILAKWGFGGV
jgi:molybdate transport system substrate-binding protein